MKNEMKNVKNVKSDPNENVKLFYTSAVKKLLSIHEIISTVRPSACRIHY